MTDDNRACSVPLIEQLRSVKPTDRVWIDESPTSGRNVPYGRMMHDAADEIERLRAARAAAPDALENCRLYAARHRKEEWAQTILRFCNEAGVTGSPLREPKP